MARNTAPGWVQPFRSPRIVMPGAATPQFLDARNIVGTHDIFGGRSRRPSNTLHFTPNEPIPLFLGPTGALRTAFCAATSRVPNTRGFDFHQPSFSSHAHNMTSPLLRPRRWGLPRACAAGRLDYSYPFIPNFLLSNDTKPRNGNMSTGWGQEYGETGGRGTFTSQPKDGENNSAGVPRILFIVAFLATVTLYLEMGF